jgi:hypothetical protein
MAAKPFRLTEPERKTEIGDMATVAGAGVFAATLAALCHETLGHGLGCAIDGGRITLLTSIWFRCQGAMSLTDAGGPLASLVGALLAFALLRFTAPGRVARFVLILFAGYSLFWFAGQLIDHAIVNGDDWAIIARRNQWPAMWRPIAVALGIAAYAGGIALTTAALRGKDAPGLRAVALAYAAGALSAVVAGLMWQPAPLRSALEALLTLGIAPLGLLVAARRAARDGNAPPIARSWPWIAASAVLYVVFLVVQARGLGPLAVTGLPR